MSHLKMPAKRTFGSKGSRPHKQNEYQTSSDQPQPRVNVMYVQLAGSVLVLGVASLLYFSDLSGAAAPPPRRGIGTMQQMGTKRGSQRACQFDELDAEDWTEQQLADRLSAQQKPLLIKNAMASWTAVSDWSSMAGFVEKYAEHPVQVTSGVERHEGAAATADTVRGYWVGTEEDAATYPPDAYVFNDIRNTSLETALSEFTGLWHRLLANDHAELRACLTSDCDESIRAATRGEMRMALGRSRTANGIHMHGQTINVLFHGTKHWLTHKRPADVRSPQVRCTQRAGELVYLPDAIPHAITNEGDSLGFLVQFPMKIRKPFQAATYHRDVHALRWLLDHGADLHEMSGSDQFQFDWTAFHVTAEIGAADVAHLLLEYGGSLVDQQDSLGRTALMIAVMNGFGSVCDVLLRGGANIHLTDKEGNTAMAWAIAADRASVIEVLASHGATPP